MSNKFTSETISDDEGVSIGSVNSYVKNFKDIAAGKTPSRPINSKKPSSFTGSRPSSSSMSTSSLPKEYKTETEKEILLHYYMRFGDGTCADFDDISGKIASSINRLFGKNLTIEEVNRKLTDSVNLDDVAESIPTNHVSNTKTSEKFEEVIEEPKTKERVFVDLKEGNYRFIPNLRSLDDEQLDLCKFIDPEHLCFSSDGYNFYLSVKPEYLNSFDKLLEFSPKEQMVYEMFKDQLGDEHKARKLVLMSRLLSEDQPKTIKKTTRKKTRRKKNIPNKEKDLK